MANEVTTTAPAKASPIDVIKQGLQQLPLQASLPSTISPEKFCNTVITAVNLNPELLNADRHSLYISCMKAAADGCIPDGREGALVVYNQQIDNKWVKVVQWQIMVAGVQKRIRNSGEIAGIRTRVVYKNEEFEYIAGDEEKITHKPIVDDEPGLFRCVYAVIDLKDGTKIREVMSKKKVDQRREASKSPNSPAWTKWYDEMAQAKVLRFAAKRCPMDSEEQDFLKQLDEDDGDDVVMPTDVTPVNEALPAPTTAPPPPPVHPAANKLEAFERAAEPPTPPKVTKKPVVTAAPTPAPTPSPTSLPEVIDVVAEDVTDRQDEVQPEPESLTLDEEPEIEIDDGTPPVSDLEFMIQGFQASETRSALTDFWRNPDNQVRLNRMAGTEDLKKVQEAYSKRFTGLPVETPTQPAGVV